MALPTSGEAWETLLEASQSNLGIPALIVLMISIHFTRPSALPEIFSPITFKYVSLETNSSSFDLCWLRWSSIDFTLEIGADHRSSWVVAQLFSVKA